MRLGYAETDSSVAYPPSCVVEELSWEALLRSWGLAANGFPMRSCGACFGVFEVRSNQRPKFLTSSRVSYSPKLVLLHTEKRFSSTSFMECASLWNVSCSMAE